MADEREKILKILLEYVTDKQGVATAKSALKDIEKSIGDTKSRVKELTKALDDDLGKGATSAGSKLQQLDKIGLGLEKTGRAIGGAWGEALTSMGSGIGSVIDAVETLNNIKGLAGAGGVGKAGAAAGGIGLGGAVGFGLAGLAGAGLGAAGYEGARAAGIAQPGSASLGQFASVGAYGAGSLFGTDTAQKWFKTVAEAVGELPPQAGKATKAVKDFGNGLQQMPSIAANAVQQAQQAIASGSPSALGVARIGNSVGGGEVDLPTGGMKLASRSGVRNYAAKIAQQKQDEANAEANQEAAQEENQYQNQRKQIIRNANAEALKAEKDFNRERKQAIASFNLETKHIQEDHNAAIAQMEAASKKRLNELANERDAVGYLQEQDRAMTEKSTAETEFQRESRQRQENFDQTMQREKENFEAMQAERKLQAQRSLDDLKASHDSENEAKQQGYDKALGSAQNYANRMAGIFNNLANSAPKGGGSQSGKSTASTNSNNQSPAQQAASSQMAALLG